MREESYVLFKIHSFYTPRPLATLTMKSWAFVMIDLEIGRAHV